MTDVPSDTLKTLTALCRQLANTNRQQIAAEEAAKQFKREAERIAREDIPGVMTELGLSSLTLDDGTTIELKNVFNCGITEARRAAAHAWLKQHGFGGLIKTRLIAEYGPDEWLEAKADAEGVGDRARLDEAVNQQTLKAFIRERLEANDPPPNDLFGLFPFTEAKIVNKSKSR